MSNRSDEIERTHWDQVECFLVSTAALIILLGAATTSLILSVGGTAYSECLPFQLLANGGIRNVDASRLGRPWTPVRGVKEWASPKSIIINDEDEGRSFLTQAFPMLYDHPIANKRKLFGASTASTTAETHSTTFGSTEKSHPKDTIPMRMLQDSGTLPPQLDQSNTTYNLLHIFLVVVATSIITCAMLLWLTCLRDRCNLEKRRIQMEYGEGRFGDDIDLAKKATASSTSSGPTSGHETDSFFPPLKMLPPMEPELSDDDQHLLEVNLVDDMSVPPSISRVSTMTNSEIGEFGDEVLSHDHHVVGMPDGDEKISSKTGAVSVGVVLELCDRHRIPEHSDLGAILMSQMQGARDEEAVVKRLKPAPCPLTPIRRSSESDAARMMLSEPIGILLDAAGCENHIRCWDDRFDRTTENSDWGIRTEEDDINEEERMHELESETASSVAADEPMAKQFPSFHLKGRATEYIRDVFFVPVPSSPGKEDTPAETIRLVGFALQDASCLVTHPIVTHVSANSLLNGRLAQGDVLLAVNGTNTAGYKVEQVVDLLGQGRGPNSKPFSVSPFIKLTVMSSHVEGTSSIEDSDKDGSSVHLGLGATEVEI